MAANDVLRNAYRAAQAAFGKSVVYRRGGQEATVTALLGQSNFVIEATDGGETHLRTVDFLVAVAALKFGDTAITPLRGDRLQVTIDAAAETYEVLPQPGVQPWRWSDPTQTHYRIHTIKVA